MYVTCNTTVVTVCIYCNVNCIQIRHLKSLSQLNNKASFHINIVVVISMLRIADPTAVGQVKHVTAVAPSSRQSQPITETRYVGKH